MEQIVAHPTPDHEGFLFCATAADLDRRVIAARSSLGENDTVRRNVSCASGIVELLRRKHRHAQSCPACLVAEALAR
jgi:hypothetical protein